MTDHTNDMEAARRLLGHIDIVPRTYTRKERVPVRARCITLSAPVADALDELPGAASHHIERALRLYLALRD